MFILHLENKHSKRPRGEFFLNWEQMLGNLFNIRFLSAEQLLTNESSQVRAKSCSVWVIQDYKNRYSCSTCSSLQNVSKKSSQK